MPAETTGCVSMTVHLPGGPVEGEVGTITVPIITGDSGFATVAVADVRRQLGELLQAAGAYLLAGGTLDTSLGVGESPSPG